MSSKENKNNAYVFVDEEDRPIIVGSNASEFRVSDKVYLVGSDGSREGPFLVESISGQKCTLCLEDGQTAKDGEEIEMARLEAA